MVQVVNYFHSYETTEFVDPYPEQYYSNRGQCKASGFTLALHTWNLIDERYGYFIIFIKNCYIYGSKNNGASIFPQSILF